MKKLVVYDFLIMLFAYIAISSFPFSYITDQQIWINVCGIIIRILFIIYLIFTLRKFNLLKDKNIDICSILLISPVVLICCSNLVVGFIKNELNWSIDLSLLFTYFGLSLFTAICEEFIFRKVAFKLFENKKPLIRIIICSSIFGAAHLVNFFSSFNPMVFGQVFYTFGIGLILGLFYEYGHSILPCILFHFLFNSLNQDLANTVYTGSIDFQWFLINILFGIVAFIYCFCVYYFVLRKKVGDKIDVA